MTEPHDHARKRQGRAQGGQIARFYAPEAEPDRAVALRADHPALAEARTIFPSSVVRPSESPRLLVSGHNNPKLGKVVLKGPWKGRPIYHLSLEERATCPRSCILWRACYGNTMHRARRHDHTDPQFLPLLRDELAVLNRIHRQGFVVRLHTLGDFYSVDYVKFWAEALDEFKGLYAFGYTHRREDADDVESRRIAKGLRWLSESAWNVFAIRFSNAPGPRGTWTGKQPSTAPDVIMCPAQTKQTEACATCGLCWSANAIDKRIGFLEHGMKKKRGGRGPRAGNAERNAMIRARYDGGMSAEQAGAPFGLSVGGAIRAIQAAGGVLRSRQAAQALRRGQNKSGPETNLRGE